MSWDIVLLVVVFLGSSCAQSSFFPGVDVPWLVVPGVVVLTPYSLICLYQNALTPSLLNVPLFDVPYSQEVSRSTLSQVYPPALTFHGQSLHLLVPGRPIQSTGWLPASWGRLGVGGCRGRSLGYGPSLGTLLVLPQGVTY